MLCHRLCSTVALLLLNLLAPLPPQAQEVARAFDQLQALLEPGETVKITDSMGRVFTATVERLSASSLTVTSVGNCRSAAPPSTGPRGGVVAARPVCPGDGKIETGDIATVSRRSADPVWNGALIGFVTPWALAIITLPLQGWHDPVDGPAFVTSLGGIALVGGGIGLVMDALTKGWRLAYAPGDAAAWGTISIAPILAPGRAGASVRWRF